MILHAIMLLLCPQGAFGSSTVRREVKSHTQRTSIEIAADGRQHVSQRDELLKQITHEYFGGGDTHENGGLLFMDLPQKCQEFAKKCDPDDQDREKRLRAIRSWPDLSAAFEVCCLGGGHESETCKAIADESFRSQNRPFAMDEWVCGELMSLYSAHIYKNQPCSNCSSQ
eukprot:TRINITY_DN43377_c0_g1_i1.p1 TRINITY_DN43377_c0_g1~~TRINITY_DN43377_c0_g1_i1.p1  ORF type:complete len:170 (-),score=19.25 TRINITY_DN43377_c0_g1_i1:17-526(-)